MRPFANRRRPSGAVPTRRRFSLSFLKRRTGANGASRVPRPQGTLPTTMGPAYLALLLVVVALVAGAFVFHLYVRFEGIHLGYETSRARAVRARMLVERRELRLELASMKSPDRVEIEAREKLGMEVPDHARIIPIGGRQAPAPASGGAL
ncbi:MAG: cell division protein FtsL [Deltaproteobacteria bacterium]|nr:cell division protein FtsL [Deltaproteobacteria bacterium]